MLGSKNQEEPNGWGFLVLGRVCTYSSYRTSRDRPPQPSSTTGRGGARDAIELSWHPVTRYGTRLIWRSRMSKAGAGPLISSTSNVTGIARISQAPHPTGLIHQWIKARRLGRYIYMCDTYHSVRSARLTNLVPPD
ncbi:hypothetical protein BDZ94DRAFT_1271993, partial [Collybia nuda]